MNSRILLADDDPLFRSTLESTLASAGYIVVSVADAAAVRQALSEGGYDILIADIHMPGNEQLELLESDEVRRLQPAVVLVTGKASVDTAVDALNYRVSAYLRKPFKPQDLFDALDRSLQQVKQRQLLARLRSQNAQLTELIDSLDSSNRSATVPVGQLTEEERQSLSVRENEVLELIAAGFETTEVARKLFISPYTVRNHMKAIYKKLGVNSHASLLYRLLARSP